MYKINWDNPVKTSKSGIIVDIGDIPLLSTIFPRFLENYQR